MILVPGKLSYGGGQTRFEVDISKVEGSRIPPLIGEQLKATGMAEVVMIARPDKKLSYVQYPGLKAFAEIPMPEGINPNRPKSPRWSEPFWEKKPWRVTHASSIRWSSPMSRARLTKPPSGTRGISGAFQS